MKELNECSDCPFWGIWGCWRKCGKEQFKSTTIMKENDFGIDFGKYNKLVYGVLFPLFIILMCALAEWLEQ